MEKIKVAFIDDSFSTIECYKEVMQFDDVDNFFFTWPEEVNQIIHEFDLVITDFDLGKKTLLEFDYVKNWPNFVVVSGSDVEDKFKRYVFKGDFNRSYYSRLIDEVKNKVRFVS